MFSMVRAFPITSFGTNGLPVVTTGYPLLAFGSGEQELNNISISLTTVTRSRTWAADDREEIDEVKTSYDGSITAYGIDADAMDAITANEKDENGNLMLTASADGAPKCVLFYRGKDAKGREYNQWLYNVEFGDPDLPAEQEGDTPATLTLNFSASSVVYQGRRLFGIRVYEGNTGYVAYGTEPTAADLPAPVVTA